jgi:hypothetical protein
MYHSYARWAGWTSGATFSLGWRAYKDEDRVTVAESAAGLLSAISMTNDGAWAHGMLVVATPDDSNPVVGKKFFNNSDPVAIFATIGTQAPGAGDTLEGMLAFYTA